MSLIALVIVLLLNLLPSTLATIAVSEQRWQAHAMARSWIEQQAARPFRELPVGLHQDLPPTTWHGTEFHMTVQVEAVAGEDPGLLRELRATVSWRGAGRDRQISRRLWIHRLPHQVESPSP